MSREEYDRLMAWLEKHKNADMLTMRISDGQPLCANYLGGFPDENAPQRSIRAVAPEAGDEGERASKVMEERMLFRQIAGYIDNDPLPWSLRAAEPTEETK